MALKFRLRLTLTFPPRPLPPLPDWLKVETLPEGGSRARKFGKVDMSRVPQTVRQVLVSRWGFRRNLPYSPFSLMPPVKTRRPQCILTVSNASFNLQDVFALY